MPALRVFANSSHSWTIWSTFGLDKLGKTHPSLPSEGALAGISFWMLISISHQHQATRKHKAKPNGLPLLPRPVSPSRVKLVQRQHRRHSPRRKKVRRAHRPQRERPV